MKLTFEEYAIVGVGADAYVAHSPDNQVVLFFKDGDQYLKKKRATVTLGVWKNMDWSLPDITFQGQTVNKQHIHYVPRRHTLNSIITSDSNKVLYSSYDWSTGLFSKFKR